MRGRGVDPEDCPNCGGSGYVAKPVDLNGKSEGVAFIRTKCPACGALAGNAQSHLPPPADRTARGTCETYGTRIVMLPVLRVAIRGRTKSSSVFLDFSDGSREERFRQCRQPLPQRAERPTPSRLDSARWLWRDIRLCQPIAERHREQLSPAKNLQFRC